MKAKEYFEQYHEEIYNELVTGGTKNLTKLLVALLHETIDICEKRHVKFDRGAQAVAKEQNDKWNAIANLFEKKYGAVILKQNGFEKWLKSEMAKEKEGS